MDFPGGYTFKNKEFLNRALTHSSYANESKQHSVRSNERLEFLGDSVLGFLCAEYIYHEYGSLPEGELTRLRAAIVCESSLHEFGKTFELGDMLLMGKGEKNTGGNKRPSSIADGVEAVLAAHYLDGGIDAARGFIIDFIKRKCEEITSSDKVVDYKTALQEIVQKNPQETLQYRLKSEMGPDHDKVFVVEVLINSNVIAQGEGKSKKSAEQNAAEKAMELMGQ